VQLWQSRGSSRSKPPGELTNPVGQRDACEPSHLDHPGGAEGNAGVRSEPSAPMVGPGCIGADSRPAAKAKRTRGEPKRAQACGSKLLAVNGARGFVTASSRVAQNRCLGPRRGAECSSW
jgi:hypothetical protein